MEMLLSIALLLLLYVSILLQIHLLSFIGYIPHHLHLILYKNLLFNCIIYAHFQVVLLHGHKHKSNHTTREWIGSQFNKIGTLLAILVHLCRTEISKISIRQWLKSSLSKHINGGGPLSLSKYCCSKTLFTSLSVSVSGCQSSGSSSNLILMSCLNWSYFVNNAITGTWKIPRVNSNS